MAERSLSNLQSSDIDLFTVSDTILPGEGWRHKKIKVNVWEKCKVKLHAQ